LLFIVLLRALWSFNIKNNIKILKVASAWEATGISGDVMHVVLPSGQNYHFAVLLETLSRPFSSGAACVDRGWTIFCL
jgi:hypothetical protein